MDGGYYSSLVILHKVNDNDCACSFCCNCERNTSFEMGVLGAIVADDI
jgi:hypothetical protein